MKQISKETQQMVGKVYQESRSEIFAIFRQALIPEDICENLVQDVFVKIMEQDIIYMDMLKGLAVTIAYHKRTDYLRRQAMIRRKQESPDFYMETSYEHHNVEAKEIEMLEMKIVSRMSETDSRVYCMSRFEDKTTDEIAGIMHLTGRATESRLYRARKAVRDGVRRAVAM